VLVSRRGLAAIPIAAFVLALAAVPLPYYSEGPGPAREVEPLIHVTGPQVYPSQGKLVLTSVSFQSLTLPKLIGAWRDPAESVVPQSVLVFPGETQQHADQRSLSEMGTSEIDATYWVLSQLKGYPKDHGAGALVEAVGSECPADGRLFPGDLIRSVDGREISDVPTLDRVLKGIPASAPLSLRVTAGGSTTDVRLTRRRCGGLHRAVIGISTVPNFPFDVSISSGDIGGPSAGLMWALGLYDLLTPGDLTGGRTIAGTGTIDPTGKVGPIGGVENKIAAAQQAGASAFLVPVDNLADARTVPTDMRLVPVRTFQDALAYLSGS
jgi:PDZ domain-containing protein